METVSAALVIAIVLAIFAVFVVVKTAVVVPQQNAFVVERLGKFHGVLDAGLPRPVPVHRRDPLPAHAEGAGGRHPRADLHHQGQRAGRGRRRPLPEGARRAARVLRHRRLLLRDQQLAQTALRSEIGKIDLDRTFEERTHINGMVVTELDKATGPWGVKVLRYEIKNITPPQDVLAAMEKQMRAEREKRAVVLTSEGERDAAINSAEGEKQQVIKESEAARQRQINEAEGQAEAILARRDRDRGGPAPGRRGRSAPPGGPEAVQLRVAEQYVHAVRQAREDQQHARPAREPVRHRLDDRARDERAARRKGARAGAEHGAAASAAGAARRGAAPAAPAAPSAPGAVILGAPSPPGEGGVRR